MRRALLLTLAVVAIPGALVVVGIVAAWRYVFRREDRLTDETMRRIRADAEQDARIREIDEIPRGRRTALDGPKPTSALSRPWGKS